MENYGNREIIEKINQLNERIRLNPSDVNALFGRAALYSDIQNIQEAINDYTNAIAIDPSIANAFYNRGNCYFQLERYDTAILDFSHALLLAPDDPITLQNRGVAFERLEQYDKAIADYALAAEIRPDLINPKLSIASACYLSQNYEQAIAYLDKIISEFGGANRAYYLYGLCHYAMQNWDKALDDFEKANTLGYNFFDTPVLCETYFRLAKLDKAAEAATIFLNGNRADKKLLFIRAICFLFLKRTTQAESDFQAIDYLLLGPDKEQFKIAYQAILATHIEVAFESLSKMVQSGHDWIRPGYWFIRHGVNQIYSVTPETKNNQIENQVNDIIKNNDDSQITEMKLKAIINVAGDVGPIVVPGLDNRNKSIDELVIGDTIQPIAFSNFTGTVKYIRLDELSEVQKAVINFSFSRFFRKDAVSDILREEQKLKGHNTTFRQEYNFRRFAGGLNLPRSQYYTICEASDGNDNGTLANELGTYVDHAETGQQQIFDLSTPSVYSMFSQHFSSFFADKYIPKKALAIVYQSRVGIASPFHSYLSAVVGGQPVEYTEVIKSFPILLPFNTKEITVRNVIDLRLTQTQQWFYENICRGIPGLMYIYDQKDRGSWTPELFVNGKKPTDFFDLLPLLMSHFIGGTTITDAIALWLIKIGAGGLIYPSARSDIYTEIVDGTLNHFEGWCLVDYSNSHRIEENELNIIPHPDGWMQLYPKCTLIRDQPNAKRAGSWRFIGNVKTRASIQQYDSELFYQKRYFKSKSDHFIKKYKLPERDRKDMFSLAELIATLKSQQLSLTLNSPICLVSNGPVQYEPLGKLIAGSKEASLKEYFQEIRFSDNWFMHVRVNDHTCLLLCPICNWNEKTDITLLDKKKFCPNCHFGIHYTR